MKTKFTNRLSRKREAQKYPANGMFEVEILDVAINGRKATVIWDLEILNTNHKGQRITVIDSLEGENSLQFLKNCGAIGLPTTPLESYEAIGDAVGRRASLVFKRIGEKNRKFKVGSRLQHVFLPSLELQSRFPSLSMAS
jgi:hypothetical protein